ncbi:nicotinate-nucleotide--dimethylbenzimidazole phosphoribosyltransferase [Streptomyces sp. NPDC006259]|uniref:nicotinate-nucleotide--dimethylbenzimidazole phosphoribosyltransferase n=1 Tax=Streptomyces sp. NPDC006259 TaxID=3364740 RepID=UPI00369B3AC7
MTDTGQGPAEGLPESAGMVDQQGVPTPGAYTYLSETTAEDEDLLLLPGAQSAWGNEVAPPAPEPVVEAVHEPGPHETAGRDSGSVDLSAVRLPNPSVPPAAPRRPLHLGPPIPDTSASPVRSLADRGPAGAPVRQPGTPAPGPEYLDAQHLREMPPQGAAPWGAQAAVQAPVAPVAAPAETVVPAAQEQAEPLGAAQAVMARLATESGTPQPEELPQQPATPEATGFAYAGEAADATGPTAVEPRQGEPTEITGAVPGPGSEPVAQVPEPAHDVPTPDALQTPDTGTVPTEEASAPAVEATEAAQAAEAAEAPGVAEATAAVEAAEVSQAPAEVFAAPEAVRMPEAPQADAIPEAPVTEPAQAPEAAEAPEAAVSLAPQAPEGIVAPDPAQTREAGPAPAAPQVAEAAPAPFQAPEVAATPETSAAPEATAPAPAPETAATPPEPEAVAPEPEAAAVPDPGAVAPVPDATAPAHAHVQAPAPEIIAPAPIPPAAETPALAQEAPEVAAAEPTALHESDQQPGSQLDHASEPEPTAPELTAVEQPSQEQPLQEPTSPEQPVMDPPAEPSPSAQLTEPVPDLQVGRPAPDPHFTPVAQHQAPPQGPAHITDFAPQGPAAPAPTEAPVDGTSPVATAPAAPPATAPQPAEPVTEEAPLEPQQAQQPLGRFTPVDGTVPTTPHLAPTPVHPLVLPTDEPATAEAAPGAPEAATPEAATPEATAPQAYAAPTPDIPAPRGAAPAAPAAEPEPDPNVAQDPEDLDTRAADQEESTAAVEEVRESTGPAAPPYDDAEREAVLKVMRERRDIRNGFRSDPIPHEVLLRVLEAAHTAPSVGHSQPWDFVVIRSAETRRAMHELAMRQRDAYAKSLPKGRAKQFKELKIEAILDTPVNIVVTADPTRGGRHTLGRHTQPQMAPYSSALAVENLWLAARAEGLGVGWVSFFDEREMVRALGLPEHLDVVAYLCVGYVDEFPDEPELMQAGWAKRRPLSWVVHEETYGRRALPGEDPHDLLAETVAGIRPLDAKALGEAWERQKRMTKPAGALGMLEIISAQLSGLSRQCPPPIPEPAAVAIFAGDHGVHAQGVTPWPQEVTAQMVANFLGGGAVCNAFANQVGAEVCVVDVGVVADLPATPGLLPRKVRAGTSDMTTGPAMSREEAKQAIEIGIETARDLVAAGNKALLTGEMGIANTTASAALISVFTGADPAEVTGRGTGINDETLARKTEVVRRALEVHQPDPADPIGVLAAVGGFEHAAMVGLLLGGASLRTPVILDGVSAGAAALVARAIAPEVLAACIAGHRSAEPGHVAALNKLGLRPLVDLDLRLGEGTGALLALPLVQSTARAMHEVATFDSAGVTEK